VVGEEIDLNQFVEVGVIQGPDGRDYSIRIARGLPVEVEKRILSNMVLGKLELNGHVYDPSQNRRTLDQDIGDLTGKEDPGRQGGC